jgi:hypothetical protein
MALSKCGGSVGVSNADPIFHHTTTLPPHFLLEKCCARNFNERKRIGRPYNTTTLLFFINPIKIHLSRGGMGAPLVSWVVCKYAMFFL